MLCQKCGKNEASFHYKTNINDNITELHLCAECAGENGESELFTHELGDYFGSMLSDFFAGTNALASPRRKIARCSLCGASARDISESGKAGCARCYDVFSDILQPYVHRIHGNAFHEGKIPAAEGRELRAKREIENLRSELRKAIDEQEFEKAAELRDRIKDMEKEAGGNEQ